MFSKPVLGHSGVKLTLSDDQALAYAFQALYRIMSGDVTMIPAPPPGYDYKDMAEVLNQALLWAKVLWPKPIEHQASGSQSSISNEPS